MNKIQVLAIPGSTRKNSSNHSLIKAIAVLVNDTIDVRLFDGLTDLPHFNPDNDNEDVDPTVTEFRQQLASADGVIICTPEYAHGVPGTLKNAIDWTISSSGFPGKPTLLITASTDGRFGHEALLQTLRAIEAKNVDNLQLVISFAKTKISSDGKITDANTLEEIKKLLIAFEQTIIETSAQTNAENS